MTELSYNEKVAQHLLNLEDVGKMVKESNAMGLRPEKRTLSHSLTHTLSLSISLSIAPNANAIWLMGSVQTQAERPAASRLLEMCACSRLILKARCLREGKRISASIS